MRTTLAMVMLGACHGRFAYEGFRQHPFLNVVGDAAVVQDELWLTDAQPSLTGAAYFSQPLDLSRGFTTTFTFDLTRSAAAAGAAADGSDAAAPTDAAGEGFAFVMQRDDPFALGAGGAGLGYAGLKDAVAVEFDVGKNEETNDPDANHISVHTMCVDVVGADELTVQVAHPSLCVYPTSNAHHHHLAPSLPTQRRGRHSTVVHREGQRRAAHRAALAA